MRIVLGLSLCLLVGCGGKKPGGGDFKDVEAKVAEVNAKVPDAHKADVKFKAVKLDAGRLGGLIPESWVESPNLAGFYQPAGKSVRDGDLTRYRLGSNCEGTCQDKDWASVVKNNEFDLRGTVVKDEALGDDGRLLMTENEGSVHLRLARWKKGGSRYFYCKVSLEPDARALADAFAAACRAMTPLSW